MSLTGEGGFLFLSRIGIIFTRFSGCVVRCVCDALIIFFARGVGVPHVLPGHGLRGSQGSSIRLLNFWRARPAKQGNMACHSTAMLGLRLHVQTFRVTEQQAWRCTQKELPAASSVHVH